MNIPELFKQKKLVASIEVFPPANDLDIKNAKPVINEISTCNPDFISVTCGAGGTLNKDNTLALASLIKNEYSIEPVAHFTCSTLTKKEAMQRINQLTEQNITNILALRGDRTTSDGFIPEYQYAKELIKDINCDKRLSIGAACYPEGHILCDTIEKEVEYTKQKVDAGAAFLVTQLIFSNDLLYPYLNMLNKAGISIPVSAGVMPIISKDQVQRMIFMCGASLPGKIIKILNKYQDNKEDLIKAGIEYASYQIEDLKKNNVSGIHIYTMNRPQIAKELMKVARN